MKLLLLLLSTSCFAFQQKDNCSENKLIVHYHRAGNVELSSGYLKRGEIDTVYLGRPSASWNCPVEKSIVFFSFEHYDSVKIEVYLSFEAAITYEKIMTLNLLTLPRDYDSRYFIIRPKLRNYRSVRLVITPYFKSKKVVRYKISGTII